MLGQKRIRRTILRVIETRLRNVAPVSVWYCCSLCIHKKIHTHDRVAVFATIKDIYIIASLLL